MSLSVRERAEDFLAVRGRDFGDTVLRADGFLGVGNQTLP
jgi:hypothetical protein